MRTLQHPFFILCLGLFILNRLLEHNKIHVSFLSSYLDDLVCFPLVLTFILAVQRSYFKDLKLIIPLKHTVFAIAAFAICFEIVLPLFKEVYTADAWDVLAYTIGAAAFQGFINKPSLKMAPC